jgi:NADPH-dependent 2,4-dienoyl-CoA reductase/sulfur reductase-like enzyme
MGRGLLADPEMPNKAKEGRLDEIRTCIACNTCMESIFRKGRIECLVNPMLGREKEMVLEPTRKPKKVMVIGGGPGGLNVAWVAAKRGHEVHVYEKRGSLGGLLLPGSIPGHKQELRSLIKFQEKQIEKFGVTCHLNHEATTKDIQSLNPDVVVLATGSLPVIPAVDGIDSTLVLTYEHVLYGAPPAFKQAVIIGGGATGLELALHLTEYGCHVTVVEMLSEIGAKLMRIESAGAVVVREKGSEILIGAERVILATGTRPCNHLYQKAKSLGYEIHRIGDCLEARDAKAAIYEGTVLGHSL